MDHHSAAAVVGVAVVVADSAEAHQELQEVVG